MIIDPLEMTTLAVVTFLAFTIAGVTGFGGGLFVMPVLLLMMDPREAGPIIGLVQLVAAASRTGLNWEGISWPIVKRLALTSLPIAAAASYLFVVTPAPIFTRIFGFLLLVMVAQGHTPWSISKGISLRSFLFVGAANGLVSGYLGPSGPVGAPFYLAYGLTGVAFVGTSSAGILMTQLPKIPVFAGNHLFSAQVLFISAVASVMSFGGSLLGNRISGKLPERWFRLVVEALLVLSGIVLIIRG
jgi:uncharacterized membrane protein YfcA